MELKNKDLFGIRGELLTFIDDPFLNTNMNECYVHYSDGLLVIENGIIVEVGEYEKLHEQYKNIDIDHYTDSVIMPGFVDCHVHYVQSPMIGSYGDTLLNWLNDYTFPTESKFKEKKFADEVAKVFFKQVLAYGTTTANVFSTTFATSVDAFFEESERYNTRMITGKVLQDNNLPDSLKDVSAKESIQLCEELLLKWHNKGRQLYAIIPRFAPTSTDEQMTLAGQLYQKYKSKGVYLHTHLDEAVDEVSWVKDLYPKDKNYTEVYHRYGMLDDHSIMAHCCLVTEPEWQLLHDTNSSVAHCPASNLFLGDGEFKFWEAKDTKRPVKLGIGTDVGGGTNFSIIKQLNEAYKVGMLVNKKLTPIQSFYLATRGGAISLSLGNKVGTLQKGFEADIAILNFKANDFISWRMQFTKDIFEKLFILQTLAPDNMNRATYVYGKKVFDRFSENQFTYTDHCKE